MVVSCAAASCLNLRWVLCSSRTKRRRSLSSSGAGGSGGSGPRASQRRSLAGHIFQNRQRAVAPVHPRDWCAGKYDNLSFLRVCLSQMDKVLGGTNGYAPLLEGGWPGPSLALLFDPAAARHTPVQPNLPDDGPREFCNHERTESKSRPSHAG